MFLTGDTNPLAYSLNDYQFMVRGQGANTVPLAFPDASPRESSLSQPASVKLETFLMKAKFLVLAVVVLSAHVSAHTAIDSLITEIDKTTGTEKVDALNRLSLQYLDVDVDNGLRYGAEALHLSRELDYKNGQIVALSTVGRAYSLTGHHQEAIDHLLQALELIGQDEKHEITGYTYEWLGVAYRDLSQYQEARDAANKAYALFHQSNDLTGVAHASNSLGLIAWRTGEYDRSLDYLHEALRLRITLKDKGLTAKTYNNLGVVYFQIADYEKALDHYFQSLRVREEIEDDTGIAIVLSNIGKTYKEWGKTDEAMEYFKRSYDKATAIDNNRAIGYALNNIGSVYEKRGEYESALEYYEKSLARYEHYGLEGVILNLNCIAVIHNHLDNNEMAREFSNRAYAEALQSDNIEGQATALRNIGIAYRNQRDTENALDNFFRSLRLYQKIGQRELIKDTYLAISDLYTDMDDHKSALLYYKQYDALKDSLFNDEIAKNIDQMRIRYETDKKEQENVILRKERERQQVIIQSNKKILTLIIAILVIIAIFASVLYGFYRQKLKAIVLLEESNIKISHQRDEIENKNKDLEITINKLKNSEYFLSESQRAARIGSFILDITTGIWTSSETLDSIFGIDSSYTRDVNGWLQIVHPEQREEMRAYLQDEVLNEHHSFDTDYCVINITTKEEKWVYGFGKLQFDTNGNPIKIIGTIQDVTDRKKAEEATARLGRILEDSLNEIYVFDSRSYKFSQVNKGARENLGYTMEELRNLTPLDIKPEFTLETFSQLVEPLRSGAKDIVKFKTLHRRKDGSQYPVDVNLQLISYGETPTFVAIINDITQQKHLEEQLRIHERMDSIGTLAGGIAHDFNNILSGIMGNLDLLWMDSGNFLDDQRENLEEARRSCYRAAQLIQNFQRLATHTTLEKKVFDLFEVVSETFSFLIRTTDRLIEKRIHIGKGEYFINGIPEQIHEVLINLGTNAVHAIEEKGVVHGDYIRISARECDIPDNNEMDVSPGRYVHIEFEDTGCGMTDDVKNRAFDPLFSTKSRSTIKGQGLGLAMVYNIVTRNHDGHIEIKTKIGGGTTFHMYLPEAETHHESVEKAVKEAHGGTETILLIDDEESILRFVERALVRYGYSVITAGDGEKGLNIFKEIKNDIDLVILDLTMPMMSGKMTLENMIDISSDVKVIISSGQSAEEVRKFHQARGVLSKPYQLNQLLTTVRNVLDG